MLLVLFPFRIYKDFRSPCQGLGAETNICIFYFLMDNMLLYFM